MLPDSRGLLLYFVALFLSLKISLSISFFFLPLSLFNLPTPPLWSQVVAFVFKCSLVSGPSYTHSLPSAHRSLLLLFHLKCVCVLLFGNQKVLIHTSALPLMTNTWKKKITLCNSVQYLSDMVCLVHIVVCEHSLN